MGLGVKMRSTDSDSTGAVTGGLAGVYHGLDSIPAEWKTELARIDDILILAKRLCYATGGKNTD